jgi:hypothetical protein
MHNRTDSETEQWVLREFRLEKEICSREICVFACDGIVTLSGTASNQKDKSAAAKSAHRVTGITSVVNNIRVQSSNARTHERPDSATFIELAGPALIPASRVESALAEATML